MCKASPAAAVNQLSAMDVRARQLHARRAHAREREAHALVDVVHRLQERAEVTSCCSYHGVVAVMKQIFFLSVYNEQFLKVFNRCSP